MEIVRKHFTFSSLETGFLLNDLFNNCRYELSKMRFIYRVYPTKRELW